MVIRRVWKFLYPPPSQYAPLVSHHPLKAAVIVLDFQGLESPLNQALSLLSVPPQSCGSPVSCLHIKISIFKSDIIPTKKSDELEDYETLVEFLAIHARDRLGKSCGENRPYVDRGDCWASCPTENIVERLEHLSHEASLSSMPKAKPETRSVLWY